MGVVLGDGGVEIRVVHLREEVEVLLIPQQPSVGGVLRALVFLEPGHRELVDDRGVAPRRFVGFSVDGDWRVGPHADIFRSRKIGGVDRLGAGRLGNGWRSRKFGAAGDGGGEQGG